MTQPDFVGMPTFDHFAYGSNLSSRRLRERCQSAQPIAKGYVRGRELRFHKVGRDGTGKADAVWTGDQEHRLWGVIYRCALAEQDILNRCESLGVGYQSVPVEVQVGGKVMSTFMYQAMPDKIDPKIRPSSWYTDHVLEGIREHRLPLDYLRRISRLVQFSLAPDETPHV